MILPKLSLKKHKKNALFLSVETVIILTIIFAILIIVAFSIKTLVRSYNAYSITRDVSQLGEAVTNFVQLWGAWPGDMTTAQASGEMNYQVMKNNITNLASATNTTYGALVAGGASAANFAPNVTMNSGIIAGFKTRLVLQQLVAAKLMPQKSNSNVTSSTDLVRANYCDDANIDQSDFAFISYSNPNVSYNFAVDKCDASGLCMAAPYSVIYSNEYGKYSTNWSNVPRIIVGSANTKSAGKKSSLCGVHAADRSGAISPDIAYIIDAKADDGTPFGGKVIGEDSIMVSTPATDFGWDATNSIAKANATTNAAFGTGATGYYGCTTFFYGPSSTNPPSANPSAPSCTTRGCISNTVGGTMSPGNSYQATSQSNLSLSCMMTFEVKYNLGS